MPTQKTSNNPHIYISNNKYDRRLYKNPYPIRVLRSIRLNKTKSDNAKEIIPHSVNLKGQTSPLKSVSVFINLLHSMYIPSHLHTHKEHNKNKLEQRILSSTKILNKRNVVDYDIIGEENEVPNEKQQHIRHAFNDSNSIGNGTKEQTISSKHLTFISSSNVQSDQRLKKIRQLSVEVKYV